EFDEPRCEDVCRREPAPAWYEGLVVGQDGRRVDHVEDVDADAGTHAPEPQDLRHPDIEFVHAIAPDLPWRDEVDRQRLTAARDRPAENRLKNGVGGVPVRLQWRSLVAPERAAELNVDLRDDVGTKAGHTSDQARIAVAERIGRPD